MELGASTKNLGRIFGVKFGVKSISLIMEASDVELYRMDYGEFA